MKCEICGNNLIEINDTKIWEDTFIIYECEICGKIEGYLKNE